MMEYPSSIYVYEVKWSFLYILFGFITTFAVILYYHELLLLLGLLPTIIASHKNFISINVTELFFSFLLVTLHSSCLLFFICVKNISCLFFKSSWSKCQFDTLCLFLFTCWVLFVFVCFLTHLLFVPKLMNFFLGWQLKNKYSLLQINAESRVKSYLLWTLSINFSISNLLLLSFVIIFWLTTFFGIIFVYNFLKNYKYQVSFVVFAFFSFLLPFDIFSQFLFFFSLIFLLELFLFFLGFVISWLITKI